MLITTNENLVIKLNNKDAFPEMFAKEAKGLQLLNSANALKIPEVVSFGEIENTSYLLLEYIPEGKQAHTFWKDFGIGLAKQHQTTQATFGLDHDNYIGSLPQNNSGNIQNAADFYTEKRLEPQFQIAAKQGFSFETTSFYKNIQHEIPDEAPALLHGDLWSGNYLVTSNGKPALIDPAVAFAPREMDISLMHLFGGFQDEVFHYYDEEFPLANGWKNRIELWQLYYLLVHLNLFGSSYLGGVQRVIEKYS
ncbi:hypothetical protein SAMN05216480_105166 [Pustulibacterium marinum]|uniref:Protein kinase domain-containing protein n=1 Tax=Pustulibacterium marinum TaxID=1224947 RepID=A0A1I7GQ53_9FLAO|nr:hypothetical protein SAMN05216480_105166 [Pustulibacterium marinum]